MVATPHLVILKLKSTSNYAIITINCDRTSVFQMGLFLHISSSIPVCLLLHCIFLGFTVQIFAKSEQKELQTN